MRTALLFFILFLSSCSSLPKERFDLFEWKPKIAYCETGDTMHILLPNPAHCPIYIDVFAKEVTPGINGQLSKIFPLVLPPMEKDSFSLVSTNKGFGKFNLKWFYLNSQDSIRTDSFFFPYSYGKSYSIMQGYNGSFSHNKVSSRYALDFTLAVGDTVCAAADGYVVGVIEGYSKGGNDSKWKDYANFINLYHPKKNVYTQYVHLQRNGSLVKVGDEVHAGQAIGISGATGWTSKPHLHFNVST